MIWLTAEQANWHPQGGGNSIWETLNHINYYNNRFVARLRKRPYSEIESNGESFRMTTEPTDEAWQATLEETRRTAHEVRDALAGLAARDETLLLNLTDRDRHNLPTWIMHDAYHTGQIVLLRKQQGAWPQVRE
jgi:uncharacterized damage-inducible protein DinB